jgi:diaminohydroxyphosphoribosylaminopyrimidine deaminase/5-amino-6-(5-phosphoribosylamino)uracil reductase
MAQTNRQKQSDIFYMKRALCLAKKGEGKVSPNPLVGVIIVKNNRIIGEGYHKKYGEAHAEINAIQSTSQSVKNATLYSTLEPCCHTDKQTPPCAHRIIQEGIKRIVVASTDPNPKVNGKGTKLIQDAGIEVTQGVLAKKNEDLNKFYFKYIAKNLPFVTIKIAQSIDGYITSMKNRQFWLTGEKAQRVVHHWRYTHDAILIGENTLRVDDPQLTVRIGYKKETLKIILCNSININPGLLIFNQKYKENTWILTTIENQPLITKKLHKTGCKIIGLPADKNKQISILSLLKYLSKQKITSILVEGGQQIFSQFIQSGYWDELNIFVAPKILGSGIKSLELKTKYQPSSLFLHKIKKLDNDILLTYLAGK